MLNYLTKSIIPIIFLFIITYGMFKGRKVYEWFIEGAKEGLNVCIRIFPCILAIIIAVEIFKKADLSFFKSLQSNTSLNSSFFLSLFFKFIKN